MTAGLACSETAAEWLPGVDEGTGPPISLLPYGIDLERFRRLQTDRGRLRREFRIPPGAPVVGHVGRLEPQKNPFFLPGYHQRSLAGDSAGLFRDRRRRTAAGAARATGRAARLGRASTLCRPAARHSHTDGRALRRLRIAVALGRVAVGGARSTGGRDSDSGFGSSDPARSASCRGSAIARRSRAGPGHWARTLREMLEARRLSPAEGAAALEELHLDVASCRDRLTTIYEELMERRAVSGREAGGALQAKAGLGRS